MPAENVPQSRSGVQEQPGVPDRRRSDGGVGTERHGRQVSLGVIWLIPEAISQVSLAAATQLLFIPTYIYQYCIFSTGVNTSSSLPSSAVCVCYLCWVKEHWITTLGWVTVCHHYLRVSWMSVYRDALVLAFKCNCSLVPRLQTCSLKMYLRIFFQLLQNQNHLRSPGSQRHNCSRTLSEG